MLTTLGNGIVLPPQDSVEKLFLRLSCHWRVGGMLNLEPTIRFDTNVCRQ